MSDARAGRCGPQDLIARAQQDHAFDLLRRGRRASADNVAGVVIHVVNEHVRVDDGVLLWTATSGVGPAVVLCHGGPGVGDYLNPVAEMIDDMATVHRWDQRGAGRSSYAFGGVAVDPLQDISRLRGAYEPGLGDVCGDVKVLGQSLIRHERGPARRQPP